MHVDGLLPGGTVAPLDLVALADVPAGTLRVRDGRGRLYHEAEAGDGGSFLVGGALGWQRATVERDGVVLAECEFHVAATTRIADAGGEFARLLTLLRATMGRFNEVGLTVWRGRIFRYFVCWLRDHVHTLKGMKYFAPELKEGIDIYRLSQREDGMIWDNIHPRSGPEPNGWDMRFAYGGFIRHFEDERAEFKRIPVENDVEYLFVEGLYYTWQATGDLGWLAGSLDAAIRALTYSVNDPLRYSQEFGLLKRGFTIDTWDFQAAEDARLSAGGDPRAEAFGDAMVIRAGHTRFGVMHGDNTGYIAACRYLAEMLQAAGRGAEAPIWRERAEQMKQRLDAVSWNGRFYRHHVPENGVARDLGVDQAQQVSLSNAYGLNRGLDESQCQAIVDTYRALAEDLPPGSPGEWYTIFPPFERGFGSHNAKWQYMNGGVTPIVAGELAHGAFEHGREAYGVNILRRLLALGESTGGHLHCAYAGSLAPEPERSFQPLDLAPLANRGYRDPEWIGEGANDLRELPTGRHNWAGVDWQVGQRCLGLACRAGFAERLEVPVGRAAASLYWLHAMAAAPDQVAGTFTVHYADGSQVAQHVLGGRQIGGWWMPEPRGANLRVAWRGRNPVCDNVGLLAFGWDNPHPERVIERIVLDASATGGIWLVAGLTLCDQPVWFEPNRVSYGIPDNWGAAAVVYALIEGLAGVKDQGTCFDRVLLAPRWAAAEVEQAEATVVYPASDGYLAYTYEQSDDELRLVVTGSGAAVEARLLLPTGAEAEALTIDGRSTPFEVSGEGDSRYVAFGLEGGLRRAVLTTRRASSRT